MVAALVVVGVLAASLLWAPPELGRPDGRTVSAVVIGSAVLVWHGLDGRGRR